VDNQIKFLLNAADCYKRVNVNLNADIRLDDYSKIDDLGTIAQAMRDNNINEIKDIFFN
jgi:hypothetical protein